MQHAALEAAGCMTIFEEKKSGTRRDGRTELQVLLECVREGDTVIVTRIDRLARSMKDLQDIVHELKEKGVSLKATEQPIDTGSAAGFSRLLLLEFVFLTCCAALWSVSADPVEGGTVYAVILLSALSMGIQTVAAGSISSGINTIVFTSALVRIVMSITGALSRAEEESQLLAAIGGHLQAFASYGCGALVAATLVWHLPKALIWVPGAAVLLALGASELAGKLQRSK